MKSRPVIRAAILMTLSALPIFSNAQESTSESEQLNVARLAIATGDYRAAEVVLNDLLVGDTKVAAAVALGQCYFETGRYQEAQSVLDSVKVEGKTHADWNVVAARVAGAQGDYDRAIEYARRGRDIDRNHCTARLLLAEFLEISGKSDEALREYEWFDRLVKHRLPIDAANLTAAGTGFYRYSVRAQHANLVQRTRHVLHKIYQKAYQVLDPKYWPARLAVADLLREKFSYEEAATDYHAVLDINTNAVDAHVGLGWIALDRWQFEEVEHRVAIALDINTNSVEAMALLARSRLLERRYEKAEHVTQRLLGVNPSSIAGLALRASARLALFDEPGAAALIKKAEQINPKSGKLHQVLARVLSDRRQYWRSEQHFLKAIELEPSNAVVRADLGLMYMQWGDEAKARPPLEKAWKLDPFDARTKYTLDLLDELDAFHRIKTDHFDVRCDNGLDIVVGARSAEYLESIYDEICRRFEIELERKTIVEIFPTHSSFGVRVTAKPWIHTVGACTGWVIAVDVPRTGSDAHGPFDLPGVLRHEFVHTVTLAATNNRIPHWMTEGLAVYHEDLPRSFSWAEGLSGRLRKGELFTLETIDWGFARPRRPNDRAMAYAQSEWMCAFLYERFGDGIINVMLRDFREGNSQAKVFKKHTEMSTQEFDAAFRKWARDDAATWGFDLTPPEVPANLETQVAKAPSDAQLQARLAMAWLEADHVDKAKSAAEASLAMDANSNALAHEVMMRVLSAGVSHPADAESAKAHQDNIIEHARQVLALVPNHRRARSVLAFYHLNKKDNESAMPHLLDLLDLPPVDPNVHFELAKIYEGLGDDAKALPQWMACLVEFEHRPQVPAALAAIHERAGQLQDAKKWYERALRVAPLSTEIGESHARVLMQMGQTDAAIAQYRLLCQVEPGEAKFHTACALALLKAGKESEAKSYARNAVKLDPKSAARSLVD